MSAAVPALAGLRVVELAGLGPGPFACALLADLGAEVVRVDRPGGGTSLVPPRGELLHRSRPCIALDLKRAGGRTAMLRLIDQADVFVEGRRPGVTERLGIGPDDCLSRNPALIYARVTGWGQTGPLASAAGHDINYAGLVGALHAIGSAAHPVPPLNLVADFGGGAMFLVVGVLAALHERATSGLGQVIDVAMVDGAASLMTMLYGMLNAGRWRDARETNLLDGGAPHYRTYACADGRFVAVGALESQFYEALLAGLGVSELPGGQNDPAYWPERARRFAEIFRTRSRDEWIEHFAETDACVTPVLSMLEAPEHPHLAERGTFVRVDGAAQPASVPRFSRSVSAPRSEPRAAGEDTREVLSTWGFDESEIDALVADGAAVESAQ